MKKQYFFFLFMLIQLGLCAQNRIAEGYVYNKDSVQALVGVEIKVHGTQIEVITNEKGEFAIDIPEGSDHLIFSMEGYYTLNYLLNKNFQEKFNIIYLESVKDAEPILPTEASSKKAKLPDSIFISSKNTLSLSIIELFAIAIAIRYERFISYKHSIGLHSSYYIAGQSQLEPYYPGDDSPNGATYTGFKAIPFYRFYPLRKKTMGLFVDAKASVGYFNFDYIWYMYSHRTGFAKKASYNFWTWGGGVSIGVMTRMPKTKHGILNFSVGYQYFPTPTPENYIRTNGNGTISILKADTDWWYQRGPGGRVEVKLTIGGIF